MLKKIYLYREGGLRFFFGDHWEPNEAIPTGFAHITFFHRKIPLNNYILKKKRVCSGGWNGDSFLVVIGTPMNTFQQVLL